MQDSRLAQPREDRPATESERGQSLASAPYFNPAARRRSNSRVLNQYALHLVQADRIVPPIVELGCPGRGMVRHGSGLL